MRYILFLLTCFANHLLCFSQTIVNPVFDRTDVFRFRVKKVELTQDTTFVICEYSAEENSWANISDKMYLENVRTGERFPIIKLSGLPFWPEKRHFANTEDVQVILYFPQVSTDKINIIEDEEEEAFNIYGIDLTRSYDSSYTSDDIQTFFDKYQKEKKKENWHAALEFAHKQLEATNYIEGIRSFSSACSIYNMTMALIPSNEYDQAIEWGNTAIDILQALPQDSVYLDVLARAYGNVGTAYSLLKQYDIANNYKELSLATRRLTSIKSGYNYEDYLVRLSVGYYKEDNYPKALLYGREAANIYKTKYEENNKYGCRYLQILNNLTGYYRAMNQTKEAEECGQYALKLLNDGACGGDLRLKCEIYNNLGGALIINGKTEEGIGLLEEVVKSSNSVAFNDDNFIIGAKLQLASVYLYYRQDTLRALNEYHSILQQIEDSLAVGHVNYPHYTSVLWQLYHINRSNPDSALKYLDKVINVQKKWNGEKSIAYANMLLEKLKYLWMPAFLEKKSLDSLLLYTKQSTDIIKRHINNSSFNMSKDERKIYWQRYKEYFTWLIPTISGIIHTNMSNSLAYDAALFYKGMLLSSEIEIKSLIQKSDDQELSNLYQNYTNYLSQLEKLYSGNSKEQTIDSLKTIIKDEEYLLSQKVTRFNKQYKGTNYSWKDVKEKLRDNDIAIEMVSYKALNDSITYYDAYVISNKSVAPQLVYLCEERDLMRLMGRDSINYDELSKLIWGDEKWQDILKGVKNIYFSATGLLNSIGIEYLPIAGNRYIHDRFNLFRLSSTRELCIQSDSSALHDACLYGGLDYNHMIESRQVSETSPYRLSRSAIQPIVKRGTFDNLLESLKEVEQIKTLMSEKGVGCLLYSGQNGTEDSFKNLSGSCTGIIHLATHGMYVTEDVDSIRVTNNYRFILSDESANIDEEDKALSRSFLVMSGGNALIQRDSISTKNEDGILTALEISRLDFSNTDLIVLSACETALGKIESEGVIGLQRGFKKAGANTILMSLDKVDDEATRILMVEFYRNLMSGKSKWQSLKDAQQYLCKVDNGKYDDPKYWASFIMLDGID